MRRCAGAVAAALLAIVAPACARDDRPETIYGVGASAPAAALGALGAAYSASAEGRVVRIDYQAAGSGAGVRLVRDDVIDFAATEEPLASAANSDAPSRTFAVPVALGALAIVANLPDGQAPCLAPAALAKVLRGERGDWADLAEGAVASAPVRIATRADASGSSAALVTYLATVDAAFAARGPSAQRLAPAWGVAVRGTDGMIAYVQSTRHALGYAEASAARRAGLSVLPLRSPSGQCVEPTAAAVERAARVCARSEGRGPCVVHDHDVEAYPLVTVTYVTGRIDGPRALRVAELVQWILDDGAHVLADAGLLPLSGGWSTRASLAVRSAFPAVGRRDR